MKKLILIALALTLAACTGYQTVPPTPQPTAVPPTPLVLVQTVVVVITPTSLPPTAIPIATLAPTEAPTLPPATEASALSPAPSGGPFTVNDNLGGGYFTNMTYSADKMSLRCAIKTVTFTAKAPDPHIVNVDFWYRIEDKIDGEISEWKLAGAMTPDGQGGFSITFSAESIHPDLRRTQAWFDFQFVGLAKSNEAVGRSEKLVKLINYSNDCQ